MYPKMLSEPLLSDLSRDAGDAQCLENHEETITNSKERECLIHTVKKHKARSSFLLAAAVLGLMLVAAIAFDQMLLMQAQEEEWSEEGKDSIPAHTFSSSLPPMEWIVGAAVISFLAIWGLVYLCMYEQESTETVQRKRRMTHQNGGCASAFRYCDFKQMQEEFHDHQLALSDEQEAQFSRQEKAFANHEPIPLPRGPRKRRTSHHRLSKVALLLLLFILCFLGQIVFGWIPVPFPAQD